MNFKRLWGTAAAVSLLLPLAFAQPAAAATVTVDVVHFEYEPDPVKVQAGDTITWVNKDPGPHTVTADDGSFNLILERGESKSFTFPTDGTFPYFCQFHGGPGGNGMAGTVQVGDVPPPPNQRLTAADTVATSIEWSEQRYADEGGPFAVIGRSDLFADSLSSGAIQGKLDAPLLLTPTGALDARVRAELERLGTKSAVLLGGPAALSAEVEAAIRGMGISTRRVSGADRLATATAAAEAFYPEARSAILTRAFGDDVPSRAFADALGAGAVAAATNQPTLFSQTDRLSDVTKAYIASQPISSVVLVGGPAALSEQVEKDLQALGVEVTRVAGPDRYATAGALAEMVEGGDALVVVDGASPTAWADGFAAAGRRNAVVLVNGDGVPGATVDVLKDHDESSHPLLCGTTVSATACSRAETVSKTDIDLPFIALAGFFAAGPAGDPSAQGAFALYETPDPSAVCYDTVGVNVPVDASHIHLAATGAMVIPLSLQPAGDGLMGCTFDLDPSVVADVLQNPTDYVVNLHNAAFAEAARGDLFTPKIIGLADMIGESEIPPGDPNGFGFAVVLGSEQHPTRVCSVIFAMLSEPATAAHIHQGASGQTGSAVVTLAAPKQGPVATGCTEATEALIADMSANPGNYYLNVHTQTHQSGAIRGQLFNPFV